MRASSGNRSVLPVTAMTARSRAGRSTASGWSAATPAQLAGASVTAKVVGEEKGPKINAMTYKNKSNQRRRWGHRQHYATLEITAITAAG